MQRFVLNLQALSNLMFSWSHLQIDLGIYLTSYEKIVFTKQWVLHMPKLWNLCNNIAQPITNGPELIPKLSEEAQCFVILRQVEWILQKV